MKRAIWGAVFNVCSRTLSVSPPLRTFRSGPLLSRFSVLTLRCYSSGNDKYNGLNSTTNENKDSLVEDDVSTEGKIILISFLNFRLDFWNCFEQSWVVGGHRLNNKVSIPTLSHNPARKFRYYELYSR